jgi:hypothetical protein
LPSSPQMHSSCSIRAPWLCRSVQLTTRSRKSTTIARIQIQKSWSVQQTVIWRMIELSRQNRARRDVRNWAVCSSNAGRKRT